MSRSMPSQGDGGAVGLTGSIQVHFDVVDGCRFQKVARVIAEFESSQAGQTKGCFTIARANQHSAGQSFFRMLILTLIHGRNETHLKKKC
ncbi:hypothetical protein Hamer_G025803 [Homarus americanus]|uniref:Uncharacterized protein n=1 Tax=Homarus americanus TaxID=6706 RepID=A0A8J5JM63_HOMAM|nr:hypothetical protein Hamer_G025803 [Homarus americanus]